MAIAALPPFTALNLHLFWGTCFVVAASLLPSMAATLRLFRGNFFMAVVALPPSGALKQGTCFTAASAVIVGPALRESACLWETDFMAVAVGDALLRLGRGWLSDCDCSEGT